MRNVGCYHLKYNKKGRNITEAIRKERVSTVHLTHDGEHFEQTLDSGRVVSALKGTPGSEQRVRA